MPKRLRRAFESVQSVKNKSKMTGACDEAEFSLLIKNEFMTSLDQSRQSHAAIKEKSLFVALVDSDATQRNLLRGRLDALGCASLALDSIDDLFANLRAGKKFECIVMAISNKEFKPQLKSILIDSDVPLLLVALPEYLGALSDLKEEMASFGKMDVVLPFSSDREIEWRLEMLVHRKQAASQSVRDFVWDEYRFEIDRRQVWLEEQSVPLKPMEFHLALELFRNMNSLVTREKLAFLWRGRPRSPGSRALDVCISNVRRKLKLVPERGLILRSIYGRGYEINSMRNGAHLKSQV
ncbi:DNA-binding response OmpR family regulator [Variovorax boronicumulans]|uniref:winged helix-turn-helix domain-containing protein n=1 Tax=Variovorax boronicumulans TaxID=436515 RepID=UPI002788AD6B|nr:winged helix-turn-helix domain-containing protein [Variovorax boronicumulans]MDQ0015886.1 DNA-binding response OmpR family regulator [Variovorax boronicumulans]